MEVTAVDNGRIELRNREPLELAPGATINLMGNLNIDVGSSNTSLSFHPFRVKKPENGTIFSTGKLLIELSFSKVRVLCPST